MDTRQSSLIIKTDVGRSLTSTFISARPIILILIAFFSLGLVQTTAGQGMTPVAQVEPQDGAPPPLKVLSKDEKTALEAETQPKNRTSLTLNLMETRLKSAEK